jgi:mannose-6-phosphate isomerase-like protein (cupin superfamily)
LIVIHTGAEQTGGHSSLYEDVRPAGAEPPLHRHPEDETFYVLDGEVTFTAAERDHRAAAGSIVYVPGGTAHTFQVHSRAARLLISGTPAGHERLFRAGGEPARERALPPPPSPLEIEKLSIAARTFKTEFLGPPPGAPAA